MKTPERAGRSAGMESHGSLAGLGQAFRKVARERAAGLAVCDLSRRLTYHELDAWSDQVAREIDRFAGAEPGVVLMPSRFDCVGVVGLIAVAKTRHAMLAVDAEAPRSLLLEIARSQRPLVGLSGAATRDLAAMLEREAGLSMLPLEALRAARSAHPLPDCGRPDDLSALRRTSGSTGEGKLVAVTNAGELSRAIRGAEQNHIAPGARYVAATSLDVGMGRGATLRALLSGATLCPLDFRRETPRNAVNRLSREGMTHFHGTPTAFRLLASGLPSGKTFDRLAFVHLGGERTTERDLGLVRSAAPADCRLKVVYSSSETGVVAHANYRAGAIGPDAEIALQIDPSVTVDILGSGGASVQPGQTGRIRVTSASVSAGYRNTQDPELTSRHNQLADGRTAFLTDDLGHLSGKGLLVLEGRTGREIKVRGQRVDLQQLEDWLLRQEGVNEAAAFAMDGPTGGGSMIVAAVAGQPPDLRAEMAVDLPGAMHPAHLIVRSELPRTASLKIDRRALIRSVEQQALEPPTPAMFEGQSAALAEAWQSVIGKLPDTPDQSFGDLGGDSVQTVSLLLRLEELTGRGLPGDFVWRYPTINAQLQALNAMAATSRKADRLIYEFDTRARSDGNFLFAITDTEGDVGGNFRHFAAAMAPAWNVTGLQSPRFDEAKDTPYSVEALAERYLNAILSVQPGGPYFLVGFSFGGVVAHEVARKLEERREPVALLLLDTRPREFLPYHWIAAKHLLDGFRRARRLLAAGVRRTRPGNPSAQAMRRGTDYAEKKDYSFRLRYSQVPTVLIKARRLVETRRDYGWSKVTQMIDIIDIPGRHGQLLDDASAPIAAEIALKVLPTLAVELARSE